jgi:hypothetical protein
MQTQRQRRIKLRPSMPIEDRPPAHYPSDVTAGQVIATAIVERLHSVPEFSRDLACAKEEYRAAGQPNIQISAECQALEKELDGSTSRAQ